MKDKRAFFDTSAIVPLIVRQETTQRARQLLKNYPRPVVSWTTFIEVHSALARLIRDGHISRKNNQAAGARLEHLKKAWAEVLMTEQLRVLCVDLLSRYDLRAADAIQLAAALTWCDERPRGRSFITFDERLSAGAEQAGFNLP